MPVMDFWKMNGAGNDFIVLDNRAGRIAEKRMPELARALCRRRLSIGADGLMVVERARGDADFRMVFYNADGSLGEMCGNGARCICRYGYERGLAGAVQRVETTAGLVTGERLDRRTYRIQLNPPSVVRLDCPAEVDGKTWACSYVELGSPGVPHAVVPMTDLRFCSPKELLELGRKLRNHPMFPKGANVNFFERTGDNAIYLRTYERGVEDFTYACGTGAGSTVTVLTLQGVVSGRGVQVTVDGGELEIDAECREGAVVRLFLTGPASCVARGEATDESLLSDSGPIELVF